MYVIKHAGKNYYTWRCNKNSSLNCPAILHTSINKTDPILKVKHEHPAEQSKIEIAKAINKIKQTAKCSGVNPSQIYAEAVSQLDVNTKARLSIENSLKRTIQNYKKKENPIDPALLEELQILRTPLPTETPKTNHHLSLLPMGPLPHTLSILPPLPYRPTHQSKVSPPLPRAHPYHWGRRRPATTARLYRTPYVLAATAHHTYTATATPPPNIPAVWATTTSKPTLHV
ncbi:hypothetical protein QTP88_023758 [Uroleucon formosanum]